MEKSMESLRHAQAKCVELEKLNKKLHTQTHTDRREIIKLREEVEVLKVKASRVDKLQLELNSQRERVEESGRNSAKLKVRRVDYAGKFLCLKIPEAVVNLFAGHKCISNRCMT